MANIRAIQSVSSSMVSFLERTYPDDLRAEINCSFSLLSLGGLTADPPDRTVTLYLHRISVNEHLRNARLSIDPVRSVHPLSLDLHYLLTVWFSRPAEEQTILAWAMRQLHLHPVLDASILSPDANWREGDVVHLVPADLTAEDIFRIWDSLPVKYRISVGYVARMVRIEPDNPDQEFPPVVARRLDFDERRRDA